MGKGQDFERQFCKQLSLWLSGGKRDDHFWRTSGSGARFTVRKARGRHTAHQIGDVAPITELAQKFLTDNDMIELKTGYKVLGVSDLFRFTGPLMDWINSCSRHTNSWMLIHRNRNTTAFVSSGFMTKFIITSDEELVYALWRIPKVGNVLVFKWDDLLEYSIPNIKD